MNFTFLSFEFVRPSPKLRTPKITREPNERELKIKQLFIEGKTLVEIGDLQIPPISRERIRQILYKVFGMTGVDGGCFIRSTPMKINEAKQKLDRERKKYHKIFGCSIRPTVFTLSHVDAPE